MRTVLHTLLSNPTLETVCRRLMFWPAAAILKSDKLQSIGIWWSPNSKGEITRLKKLEVEQKHRSTTDENGVACIFL